MKDVTVGIFLLVIFVLLPLLNWLLRRFGRRRERQPPQPPYMPAPRQQATVSEPRPRAPQPPRDRIHVRETPSAPAAIRRRGISTNSLFRTRAEMRRAFILLTILGPCRAVGASKERDSSI